MVEDKEEIGAPAASRHRATDASHQAPSGLGPDGSVSTGARVTDRVAAELGCAMTPWEYNDPEKFSQGHGKLSETAIYARGNAFQWRMAEVQCSDEATEIATARLMAAAPELYAELDRMLRRDRRRYGTSAASQSHYRRANAGAFAALAKARGESTPSQRQGS